MSADERTFRVRRMQHSSSQIVSYLGVSVKPLAVTFTKTTTDLQAQSRLLPLDLK
jgi:hypothetical protein